jgi:transposase
MKNKSTMIRSSKHYFQDLNTGKLNIIHDFLNQYNIALQYYIDYIWDNLLDDSLNLPKYIDYNTVSTCNISTKLYKRVLSACSSQALGIVKGRVAIKRKLIYVISKRKEQNLSTDYYEKKLSDIILTKPIINKDKIVAELSSKNIDIKYINGHFNLFIRLKCTGYPNIKIPIKFHKQDKKWLKSGKLLNAILLSRNNIQLRYEIEKPKLKEKGITVGADTGMNNIITLSNNVISPKIDIHGHSLNSILDKLSKKKKGSKSFKKCQDHRTNFINWSINQLNLENIKVIKLEKVSNIFYKKNTSRKLSGWTNRQIQKKVLSKGEESGVQIILQSCTYRSQRCSGCGVVCKQNRKGSIYKCKDCGLHLDSDLNASLNHEIDLPDIPYWLQQLNLNKASGFLWKPEGFYDLIGKEIRVPCTNKDNI